MELIKDLGTRLIKGVWIRYGLFLCPFCLQEIIRGLRSGLKQQSCGCVKNKLIGKGNTGKKRTEEQKKNYSKAFKGRIVTEETREKIGLGNKGKKRTEEYRQSKSESQKRKWLEMPIEERKKSKDTKDKISKSKKEKKLKPSDEWRRKHSIEMLGIMNPNWNNGSSFLPYPPEFNKELKQSILERDNYECQNPNCEHLSEGLDCHHIDYDKKNNNSENVITLCDSCHSKTNGKNNRQYWIVLYQNIMEKKINV